jgi:hypothetical protein
MGKEPMAFGTVYLGEIFRLLTFSIPKVGYTAIKRMGRRYR